MEKQISFTATAEGGSHVETFPIDIEIFPKISTKLSYHPSTTTEVCTHKENFSKNPDVVFKCSLLGVISCLIEGNEICVYNSKFIS
jgi:hypothetical protein